MSNTIRGGRSIDLNVQAGESLKVSTLTGTYTATVLAGAGAGTALATESSGGATYGPYAAGVVIRVKCSADGLVDIDVGVSPALNYAEPARFGYGLDGDVSSLVDGDGNVSPLGEYSTVPQSVQSGDLYISRIDNTGLTLPNPYPAQANAPVHPAVLYFPNGWNGNKYWMAFTPYPSSVSDFENPTMAVSNDGQTWRAIGRQPLVDKPANGYNADPHLFMSPDGATMYMAFRERIISGSTGNFLKVMHTTDGVNWSTPQTIKTGAVASQDYASPSIWWNGTGWTCVSHNLDAATPWPVQRMVSATADVYGAWGAPSAVTVPAFAGRSWWHSFSIRMPSGQILGLFQDNAQIGGSGGYLYWCESADDGVTFDVGSAAIAGQGNASGGGGVRIYRSAFAAREIDSGVVVDLFMGDLANYRILRHSCQMGAQQIKQDFASRRALYLSLGTSKPSSVAWADTFTRADNAGTLGTASGGGTYTTSGGTWGISGNRAYPAASGRVYAAAGGVNHEVSVRFLDMTASVQQWLIARFVDASNFWRCGCSVPQEAGLSILVLQSVAAGAVVVQREIGAILRGDVVTMRAVGAVLTIAVNGIDVHREYTTTALTGSNVGMQGNAGATSFFDDLVCTTL